MSNSVFINSITKEQLQQVFHAMVKQVHNPFASKGEQKRTLWSLPVRALEFAYQLTPSASLKPYYPEISSLNASCLTILAEHQLLATQIASAENTKATSSLSLQSHLLSIRPWQLEDASTYAILLNPSGSTQSSTILGQIRIEFQSEDVTSTMKSAEISYWLGKNYQGMGIMSALLPAFTSYCFTRFQLEHIFALVLDTNTQSSGLLMKTGYILETPFFQRLKGSKQQLFSAFRADYSPVGFEGLEKSCDQSKLSPTRRYRIDLSNPALESSL